MIAVSTTKADKIEYVEEREGLKANRRPVKPLFHPTLEFEVASVQVEPRDWDVTDPEARERAAIEQLGELDEHYDTHARWFINPDKNAAVLIVFRPKPAEVA